MDWTSVALLTLVALYLIVNLVVMVVYGFDKHRARTGGRRVSEKRLLLIALLGPFGAMAGMKVFRHKTRKALFKLVPVFTALHVLAMFFLLY